MLFLLLLCAMSHLPLSAQKVAWCNSKEECHYGFFCDTSTRLCLECLNCEELQREPIVPRPECITSVAGCGPCLDGLVESTLGDLKCVLPRETSSGSSYYIWAIIIGSLVIVFLIVAISVCVFKWSTLKISSRTCLRQTCEPELRASAPEPPPPYNPHSPGTASHYTHQHNNLHTMEEGDMARPFIKHAPSARPDPARESSDNQNARMYNPPTYLRSQPSPNSLLSPEELNSPIHDENTSESNWTPTVTSVNNLDGPAVEPNVAARVDSDSGAGDIATLLAAARDSTLVEPPPKKIRSHDTNNNGNNGNVSSDSSSSVASTSHGHSGPAMFLNIQVNNTLGPAYSGQLIKTNKS